MAPPPPIGSSSELSLALEGRASSLRPPFPGAGRGRPRGPGLELGFVRCAPHKPPARRGAEGGRPQRPPSPRPLPRPWAAAAVEAQAQSGCWAGAGAGLWLPVGTKQRGVGGGAPTLRGEAPAFSTALPRAGEGTWLGEGAINICK